WQVRDEEVRRRVVGRLVVGDTVLRVPPRHDVHGFETAAAAVLDVQVVERPSAGQLDAYHQLVADVQRAGGGHQLEPGATEPPPVDPFVHAKRGPGVCRDTGRRLPVLPLEA